MVWSENNEMLARAIEKLLLDQNNKYPIEVIVAWAKKPLSYILDITQDCLQC